MLDKAPSNVGGGPIVAAVLAVALFVSYVAGYFAVSEFHGRVLPMRKFHASWQVGVFTPALMVEKRIRGDLWAGSPLPNGDATLLQVD